MENNVRCRRSLMLAAFAALAWSAVACAASGAPAVSEGCATLPASASVEFGGQLLKSLPDIADPELRHIDALIRGGCHVDAYAALTRYQAAHRNEYRVDFLRARLLWANSDDAGAIRLLDYAIAHHPDFYSARTLRAELAVHKSDYALAARHLDVVAAATPDSLEAFVERLRLAVYRDTSAQAADTLISVVEDARFDVDVRERAAFIVIYYPSLPVARVEAAHRGLSTFESAMPAHFKASMYARFLLEFTDRYAQARVVLEPVLAAEKDVQRRLGVPQLMAESFLLEAARLDPAPTQRNAGLVSAARQAVGDNLASLRAEVQGMSYLSRIAPFVRALEGETAAEHAAQ